MSIFVVAMAHFRLLANSLYRVGPENVEFQEVHDMRGEIQEEETVPQ